MLGKDTVLFVTDEKFVSANLLKDALNKDSKFLGITVASSDLESAIKSRTKKVRRFLKANVWKPISAFIHKFYNKIKVPEEPYLCDVMSKKKVYNMFFRYAPAAVVASDATIRYSLEEGIKRAGMNVRIFVYSDELGFDFSLLSDSVNHYFVDNIAVRDKLREKGVSSSAIDVNPLPIESEYFEGMDAGVCKQRIGLEPTKELCLICPANGESIAAAETKDVAFVTLGETIAAETNADGENKASERELFFAADYIAARFDSFTVKRAAALKKPLILICDEEKNEEGEYLIAAGKAVEAKNGGEIAELIAKLKTGEISVGYDDADVAAQDKVAARIKELIDEAKMN